MKNNKNSQIMKKYEKWHMKMHMKIPRTIYKICNLIFENIRKVKFEK